MFGTGRLLVDSRLPLGERGLASWKMAASGRTGDERSRLPVLFAAFCLHASAQRIHATDDLRCARSLGASIF
jgi:hypothetical protein